MPKSSKAPAKETSKKKPASARRSAGTAKSAAVKKKAVKKIAKKSTPKKTARPAKAKKQQTTSTKTSFQTKLDKVQATKNSKTRKKTASKKGSKTKAVSIFSSLQLMIPAGQRFPLDVDLIATQSARLGGLVFVCLGALYTVYYAQLALNTDTQNLSRTDVAATYASLSAALIESAQEEAVPEQPPVTAPEQTSFSVESSTAAASSSAVTLSFQAQQRDIVTVTVDAKTASATEVYLLDPGSGVVTLLGSAMEKASSTWSLVWSSADFSAGTYELYAEAQSAKQTIQSERVAVTIDAQGMIATSTAVFGTENTAPPAGVSLEQMSEFVDKVAVANSANNEQSALVTSYLLMGFAAVSVSALGLVLILLGHTLHVRRKELEASEIAPA